MQEFSALRDSSIWLRLSYGHLGNLEAFLIRFYPSMHHNPSCYVCGQVHHARGHRTRTFHRVGSGSSSCGLSIHDLTQDGMDLQGHFESFSQV